MKIFSIFLKIGLPAIVLLCGCLLKTPIDSICVNGNCIVGSVLLENGTPTADVVVFLYPVTDSIPGNLLGLDTSACKQQKTDSMGNFIFDPPEKGMYVLKVALSHPETGIPLLAYRPPFAVSGPTNLGEVRLQPTGSLTATAMHLDSSVISAQCYIPLTPFHSKAGDSGVCNLDVLPPGLHSFNISAEGFTTFNDSTVLVEPGKKTNLGVIGLLEHYPDRITGPSSLASEYYTSEGITRLYWKIGGKTCGVYRRVKGQSFQEAKALNFKVTANSFEDTVYCLLTGLDTLTLVYSLVIEGAKSGRPYHDFPPVKVIPPNFPFRPTPDNEKTGLGLSPVLNWTYHPLNGSFAVFDVYQGTGNPPTELVAEGLSSSRLTLSSLTYGTTYFWMVIVHEEGFEEIKGPVWSFRTKSGQPGNLPPNFPASPVPPDKANGIPAANIRLSWTGGDPDSQDRVFYDIYLAKDTSSVFEKIATGLTNNSHLIPHCANGSTYKWKIHASDTKKVQPGPIWRFTTLPLSPGNLPPNPPSAPTPPDKSVDQPLSLILTWRGGDPTGDNVTYSILFGSSKPLTEQLIKGISSTSYKMERKLNNNTTYYWSVTGIDDSGATNTGPEWSFTTVSLDLVGHPPNQPSAPNPPDKSVDQPLSLTFDWKGGDPDPENTVTYDFYFGTKNPPPFLVGNLGRAVFKRSNLESGQVYFWQVKSSDQREMTEGPVWHFTTRPSKGNSPDKPLLISPATGSSDQKLSVELSWSGNDPDGDSLNFDVLFDLQDPPKEKVAQGLWVSSYTLKDLQPGTHYYWSIVASDGRESAESSVFMFRTEEPPSIYSQPIDCIVRAGQSAVFEVGAKGTKPLFYEWRRKGSPITGADLELYKLENTSASDDGAEFDVIVSNSVGNITSKTAILRVTQDPIITKQPGSISVMEGQDAKFSVAVSGIQLSYQWQRNGERMSGETSDTYILKKAGPGDDGALISVEVSGLNSAPVQSDAAKLTVELLPPKIIKQPYNQKVNFNEPATFTVTAEGSQLQYQWYQNNKKIDNALSASYQVTKATWSENNAKFKVAVSNKDGKELSDEATLTITTDKVIKPPPNYTYCCDEGQICLYTGTVDIAFGTDSFYEYLYNQSSGSIPCNNASFGTKIYKYKRECFIKPVIAHTLTTTTFGQGSVSPDAGTYPEGDSVELTATPAKGWKFNGWTGDVSGTENPLRIIMDVDKFITATFKELPLIRLEFNENSGPSVGNTGTASANFSKTTIPEWSANVPANGGAGSVDFGTIPGNYSVESESAISELAELSSFTVTGWVNNRDSSRDQGGQRIVSWINNGGHGVDITFISTGALKVGINQWSNRSIAMSSPGKMPSDADAPGSNWRFFAVTYVSSTGSLSFYFGGNTTPACHDKTITYNRGIVGADIGKLSIGHFNAESVRIHRSSNMFRGLIDQIEIYGSAFTLAEIQTVQNIASPL